MHKSLLLTIHVRTYVCSRVRNQVRLKEYIEDNLVESNVDVVSNV